MGLLSLGLEESASYSLLLHHFVESCTDLGEVALEGPRGLVELGEELGVGVMVEHVVDAPVGLGGQVRVHQLQQQVPTAGQDLSHHGLVEGELHLPWFKMGIIRHRGGILLSCFSLSTI